MDARNVEPCNQPLWLKPWSGWLLQATLCARGKVKRVGNSLFSTIQALKYRGNRSYKRGRDANGGEGVKSEVERRGSDRQRSESRYEMETRGARTRWRCRGEGG
jgi:hypothetical protein